MIKKIAYFIQLESFSGILLCFSALLGLMIANSPVKMFYQHFLYQQHGFFIVNDGLMTFFFLLVGLEIKREILTGELNSAKKIRLPAIAALFGMMIPALIYSLLNYTDAVALKGWAIPTATDIAFALAVLNLLNKYIPFSLKVFLTALAIFDDLGAIIIIACFYSDNLSGLYLIFSSVICLMMLVLNKYFHCKNFFIYGILSVILWYAILKSGIHPTFTGVLLAAILPCRQLFEKKLSFCVAVGILPVFAFTNMGIAFGNLTHADIIFSWTSLGILLGLLIGKQLGIFLSVYFSVKYKLVKLPTGSNYKMLYGVALLCGIGFTMSLFIGNLAFNDQMQINMMRAGVLWGSLLSGLAGYSILRFWR